MSKITKISSLVFMLSLSCSTAWASPAGGQQNPMSQFIILGLFMVFLYFMIIRPQSKRAKEHKALIESLAKADEIVTSGGMVGKITKVGESFIGVEVAPGVEVHVQKNMVVNVLPKGTIGNIKVI